MEIHLEKPTKQVWKVTVKGTSVTYEWGKSKDHKQQQKIDKYSEGKQKRTPAQQAQFEALATAKKKIRGGYKLVKQIGVTLDLKDSACGSDEAPKPMLAANFNDHKHKLKQDAASSDCQVKDNTIFLQRKYDGIRCLGNLKTGKLYTRGRKPILGLGHIENDVISLGKILSEINKDIEWVDGEIFKKGLSFQAISSLTRKQKNLSTDSLTLEYHIYDIVDTKNGFEKRHQIIADAFKNYYENWGKAKNNNKKSSLVKVETKVVNVDNIFSEHKKIVDEGYEGSIVRLNNNVGYELDKRSMTLLKVKDFIQEEYQVVGFNAEKHEENETLGSVILKLLDDPKDKRTFSAAPSMTDQEKKEIWDHQKKYLKMKATIKFFEFTDGNVPRFPVLLGFI